MHRKVSILTQSKETQPKHEDQTTVEHYYIFFSFFFLFQALVCAEVTVLQEMIPPTLLLFQTKQLHFTINGQWSQLTIFLHLHPLLTILYNPVGQNKNWIRKLNKPLQIHLCAIQKANKWTW